MPDKPILNYASPARSQSPARTAATPLPGFALGTFVGAFFWFAVRHRLGIGASQMVAPEILIAAVVITLISCATVWVIGVLLRLRSLRGSQPFRYEVLIGCADIWLVCLTNTGVTLLANSHFDSDFGVAICYGIWVVVALGAAILLAPGYVRR